MTTIDLQPPLVGYICTEEITRVYVPAIASLEPEKGHVGRFLLSLQDTYDEVVVPGVISPILGAMLERRGYKIEKHWAPELEEHVDCFVWRKSKRQ